MTPRQTAYLLIAALVTDVTLEIMNIKVPHMVLILAGFAIRHIATVEGVKDIPTITSNGGQSNVASNPVSTKSVS